MNGRVLLLALAAAALLAPAPARAVDPGADFAPIARVLLSPRCKNCHPAGDAPLVGDLSMKHRMNVTRASSEAGLPCTTCHRSANAHVEHGPPGVPNWRMPPREHPMVFEGKTPRELCESLKDPARNGGKKLPALEEHFASDPIVLWSYDPGPGRSLPPVPHGELVREVKRWIASGAPCP
jgi:hypothetical protein